MVKALFLSLSPLDNDNRILKEIKSLLSINLKVFSISVATKKEFDFFNSISVKHTAKRIFGIPGISSVLLYYKVIKESIKHKNSSIIHCNDLNTLPIGVIIKKFFNKDTKIVYDAHEYEIN
uniref:hypothetical protein n=1 Tax=Aliarcobacter butzleri TaxID=28197 RepID=UPI002B248431